MAKLTIKDFGRSGSVFEKDRFLNFGQKNTLMRASFKRGTVSSDYMARRNFLQYSMDDKFFSSLQVSSDYTVIVRITFKGVDSRALFLSELSGIGLEHAYLKNFSSLLNYKSLLKSQDWVADLLSTPLVCSIRVSSFADYKKVVSKCIALEGSDDKPFFLDLLFTRERDTFIRFDVPASVKFRELYSSAALTRESILLELCGLLLSPATNIEASFARVLIPAAPIDIPK